LPQNRLNGISDKLVAKIEKRRHKAKFGTPGPPRKPIPKMDFVFPPGRDRQMLGFSRNQKLTDAEIEALAEAERTIADGLHSFRRLGEALDLIKTHKLYRATHASFEDYLADRWKITTTYATKLTIAANVSKMLVEAGLPEPTRESHVREIAHAAPDRRAQVWQESLAVVGGDPEQITAEVVAQVVKKTGKPRTRKARRRKPAAIRLRGKGWSLVLERATTDIDVEAALRAALDQIATKSRAA
jgi:hypothetical protein